MITQRTISPSKAKFFLLIETSHGLTQFSEKPYDDSLLYNAYLQTKLNITTQTTYNDDDTITVAGAGLAPITFAKQVRA